ncbi:hypothetical protein GWI33_017015 [Rhynchophorus ferrugineus]|uniref:Uncharacterized protein n=1 Tax=Rhynchophorus ferrugineus TaxID=354439 RepID=A0A834M6L4_RHYFE|nr:hypothetical protein GWI33_017015 [Rhynchophorus ferrugineus]
MAETKNEAAIPGKDRSSSRGAGARGSGPGHATPRSRSPDRPYRVGFVSGSRCLSCQLPRPLSREEEEKNPPFCDESPSVPSPWFLFREVGFSADFPPAAVAENVTSVSVWQREIHLRPCQSGE